MFFNHLKVLVNLILYCYCHLLLIFTINLYYCDILTYFYFHKLLAFNNLVAISFYEILFTKFYLTIISTVCLSMPILFLYLFLYISSGLYLYEFQLYFNYYLRVLQIYFFELILCLYFVIPYILKSSSKPLENDIVQIYSYGNITSLILKFLILWLIVAILVYLYKSFSPFPFYTNALSSDLPIINKSALLLGSNDLPIKKINAQPLIPRRYVPLLAFIIGFFGPFGVDVFIQGIFTIGLFIYIEVHSFTKYWSNHRKLPPVI